MTTEAATALKLANSYLDEVVGLIPNPFAIEPQEVNEIIKSLDLAAKQLDKAERLDPAVTVTHDIEVGSTELDVNTTRSSILLYKGLAIGFGRDEKTAGAKLIEQSIGLAGADFGNAHYALAILYADLGRKAEGIQHLRKAVELEPDNIDFQKMLDRVQNESGLKLQIGAFRGSWKFFLVLCAVSLVGLMTTSFSIFLLFGALAAGYWWWKSR